LVADACARNRTAISSVIARLTWVLRLSHDHQRAAELLVRGVRQAGVVRLGEALA
jgi:hypothetical protein